MDSSEFKKLLSERFPFVATDSQKFWLESIVDFLYTPDKNVLYLLKGYAGTGKSTLIGHLVKLISMANYKAVLMAPTGRAAKVIANYSGKKAFTIHKQIYFTKAEKGSGVQFVLKPNKYSNTLFIVDEASMIGDDRQSAKLFENGSLLDDLMQYVDAGTNCKLLLVGDPAQLPPVHLTISPALDGEYLENKFNKEVTEWELKEVVRQQKDSGILSNATQLRLQMNEEHLDSFLFDLSIANDVQRLQDGNEILELLDDALRNGGLEETVFIVRSNKRANLYNQQIRGRILFLEADLSVGDQLMVVKNNYFWLEPESDPGFIANGDLVKVLRILSHHELYNFKFAKVEVQLVDYPDEKPFETVVLLDTLSSESPSLTYEEGNQLYQSVQEDYQHLSSKYKRFLAVKNNPYFNALQVKYSYAITCHKSQGGQWKNVFIEQPYLPDGPDLSYFRWLYTALTRAQTNLYLVGFQNDFFKK
ncbi:MAG: ATP-dependent DNA helicase [Flavobacteriales bacterium]|tara:strand:+ start:906 stop:2330 length:1425 start_codon:yes stop_codon:yes gene_type:complete